MKRRVGKYKNKIIVEGDKNEFKPHEVSIKELAGTDNGGSGDSNGIGIKYYRVVMPTDESVRNVFLAVINSSSSFINYNQGLTHCIGAASIVIQINTSYDYNILAIGFINKKVISIDNGEVTTLEGTLQERADFLTRIFGVPKFNINDYLESITEEEFYNIKPE